MFQVFRSRDKSVRIVLGVVLVFVAISMLWYLIPGGFGPSASGDDTVAVVGDQKITPQDVQRAINQVSRGQNLPKGMLAMYVPSLVNQLIESKALAYQARQMGLRVSDEELGNVIQSQYAAQIGGKFDPAVYQRVVEDQGMTVPDFEKVEREQLLAMRLEDLESRSLVVTDQEARAEYQRKNLKIGLQYVEFSDKDFTSKVSKDPAAIKAYFDKNRAQFRTPEKRDVVLVVGSLPAFLATAQISDAQLEKEYKDNIDSYRVPERVRARHILIKTQGKSKDQQAAAKTKAEDLLKQIQHGGDFAELAKKNSEDPGSAEKGGELGWIVRGQTVPNFEKTLFALNPGQTSGIVETEYGYHIIQAEEKQNAHTMSFDQVKPQIQAELSKQLAMDNMHRAMDAARDQIAKNPSQASEIAAKYHLEVSKVDGFTSSSTLPDIGSDPSLVNAIFTSNKGGATDVVNMDNQGKEAFAVVTNITPARNAEFNEDQAEVVQKYTQAEAMRLATEAAKAAADRAKKGESLEAIAKSYGVQVKTAAPFTIDGAAEGLGSAALVAGAFKDNVGDIVGPVAAQNGQFVCKVSDKIPADMSQFEKNKAGVIQSLQAQKAGINGPLFRDSIVTALRKKGKIKINQDTLQRIIGSFQS